jgi:hypothetical protein
VSDPRIRKGMILDSLGRAMKEDQEESMHRQLALDKAATDRTSSPDAALPDGQKDSLVDSKAHISQKIYYFPESFNALRRELEENYPNFFNSVNPEVGMSPAYAMVFDAPKFVGMCNGATDGVVQFDSHNVDGICKEFLNKFRAMRGLSPL